MILIIGARSKIGAHLVRLLVERDEPVRALLRPREPPTQLTTLGVEIVEGDLAQPDTIRAAFAGVDRAFLLSGPHPDAVIWHNAAVDIAVETGVRRLVRSSILGADPDSTMTFARQHGESDRYLQASGVGYSIIRPNYFLQNVTEQNAPSIGADGMLHVPAGDARLSMTDTRDAAAVAAVALTEPGHAGRIYDVTGPHAVSHHEVARQLGRALGREIRYVSPSLDTFRTTMAGYGLDRWLIAGLAEMYADYQRSGADGYAARVTDTVQRLTGRPAGSLAQLLAEWSQART